MFVTQPHSFLVLYIGETVADARIIAATADAELVQYVAAHLLQESKERIAIKNDVPKPDEPCVLRLITDESNA